MISDLIDELISFLTARLDELEQEVSAEPIETSEQQYILDDIAAKRKLLAWAVDDDSGEMTPIRADGCINGEWGSGDADPPVLTEQLLKLIALPFSWHRDYRDGEWKP